MDVHEFAKIKNDAMIMKISPENAKQVLMNLKAYVEDLSKLMEKHKPKVPPDLLVGPLFESAHRISNHNMLLEQQMLMRQALYEKGDSQDVID